MRSLRFTLAHLYAAHKMEGPLTWCGGPQNGSQGANRIEVIQDPVCGLTRIQLLLDTS